MRAQVFRALRPAPSSEACAALLACLHKCLSLPSAPTALRMAVDIVLSLQVRPTLRMMRMWKVNQSGRVECWSRLSGTK